MPRFFVDTPPQDEIISITGDDARHIGRAQRMRIGDSLTVCHDKTDYICTIMSISDNEVVLKTLESRKACEPSIELTLFMAMPKSDKFESVIQKSTELGAVKIVPVLTRRCVSRPEKKQFQKKLDRLNKIALEAAKQSGRGIVPQVSDIINLDECAQNIKDFNLSLVCYEKGGISLSECGLCSQSGGINKKIALIIGSEGGFDEDEILLLESFGAKRIWLGERILRCETAPVAAMSIIMHLTGNM